MGCSGLVASEHSRGNRIQRGSITKTSNAHLRRVGVEAGWPYRHRPNVTGFLLRRQKSLTISDEVKQIAWEKHGIDSISVTKRCWLGAQTRTRF